MEKKLRKAEKNKKSPVNKKVYNKETKSDLWKTYGVTLVISSEW